VDVGYDVPPVDLDVGVARCAQRGVQHRAVLGHVDALAGEHRLDARRQVGRPRDVEQRGEHLVGDQVLGVVEVEVADLERHPLPALRVGLERRPEEPA
jgi:hypothetical protein